MSELVEQKESDPARAAGATAAPGGGKVSGRRRAGSLIKQHGDDDRVQSDTMRACASQLASWHNLCVLVEVTTDP